MALTSDQVQTIRSTVPVLQHHGNAITSSFYDTLLKEAPALNNVFNQANQTNNHQAKALAGALYAYASHIDDLGALSPAVEKICQKHASLYIQADQYKVVGEYLLRAMGDVLGAAFTPDILSAWGAAYWQLANIMIKREEQLLQEAGGWTDWRDFRIADKVKESDEITSFYFKPVDGEKLPDFLPGQYISIMTDVPRLHFLQSRQYSLSDAPNPDYYRISIKKETGLDHRRPDAPKHPGYISNVMHDEKQVGDVIKMSHPAGDFFCDSQRQDRPVVLVCAGVGLTPMVSILNTITARDSNLRISFVHGAHSSTVRAFSSHIRELASTHPNVSYTSFITNPDSSTEVQNQDFSKLERTSTQIGRLELSKLDRTTDLCLDNDQTLYFVCGPAGFMTYVETGLCNMGVEKGRIRTEKFGVGDIPTD